MADKVIVSREKLVAIADAVREKTGGTDELTLDEVAGAIEGGLFDELVTRTVNGVYKNSRITKIGGYAFYGCTELTGVDTPNVSTLAQGAFNSSGIIEADFPLVEKMTGSPFNSCMQLKTVKMAKLGEMTGSMFQDCRALVNVDLPVAVAVNNSSFNRCYALEKLVFPSVIVITSGAFQNCKSLKALVLLKNRVCELRADPFAGCNHFLGTVDATYNPEGLKDGYVYVPAALIDQYKVAANWSTYADQFRAIEDYPEIMEADHVEEC